MKANMKTAKERAEEMKRKWAALSGWQKVWTAIGVVLICCFEILMFPFWLIVQVIVLGRYITKS